jgi:hypothetical protein
MKPGGEVQVDRRQREALCAEEAKAGMRKALIRTAKKSTVLQSSSSTIAVSVRTLEAEQAPGDKEKALRLFCRAMIQLYIRDQGNPDNGTSLGVL